MEISSLHGGLLIKGKACTLAINPFGKNEELSLGENKVNAVLISNALFEAPEDKKTQEDTEKFFSWPGEYEVRGVSINAKYEYADESSNDKPKKLLFHFFIDGLKICYLPELTKELHSDLIEAIGDLDLLIMPMVKDQKILTNTLEEIEPKAVLGLNPEADQALKEQFIKSFGLSTAEEKPVLKINSKSDFSSDKTDLFLLANA